MAAFTAHTGHAYHPRQGDLSISHTHAVLDQPLDAGRLRRDTGDALCRPRARFWGLEPATPGVGVTCPECLSRAERYGVTLTGGPHAD